MASEEPLFDPSLKKRKKKSVAFSEETADASADPTIPALPTDGPTVHEQVKSNGDAPAAKEGEDEDFKAMFGDLKKKKKKKEIPLDLDEGSGTATPVKADAPAVTEDLDFSDLKKKKKSSKKKAAFDLEAFEKELGEVRKDDGGDDDGENVDGGHLENIDEADLGENVFAGGDAPVGVDSGAEPWLGSDRDYAYPELLSRFYAALHAANPALLSSSGKRFTIAPPNMHREGNKKSVFVNVTEICKRMHRQPEHVIQFLFAEMGTTGSVDGQGRLVIKGRFTGKQVENVLRRYIVEYVTCKTCKSLDTLLTKENRIFFMSCESCGSRRSVNAIKTGFQAQVGKRSKTKTG